MESAKAGWDGLVTQLQQLWKASPCVTRQAKSSSPQCVGSPAPNGACNSLSCTIRSCAIRSVSSGTFALHALCVAFNFAIFRSQVTTWLHANRHHILGKWARPVRSFIAVREKHFEMVELKKCGKWVMAFFCDSSLPLGVLCFAVPANNHTD